jgi:hypothetical protein
LLTVRIAAPRLISRQAPPPLRSTSNRSHPAGQHVNAEWLVRSMVAVNIPSVRRHDLDELLENPARRLDQMSLHVALPLEGAIDTYRR